MLTHLTIRNFKRFVEVDIELGNPVVFIGPNNSGKITALQALALWEIGVKRWREKRSRKQTPDKRTGIAVNRRDLLAVPVPHANLLWRQLQVRNTFADETGRKTQNIRIDIIVRGVTADRSWKCGLEFDYANEESFYCRPLRRSNGQNPDRMEILDEAADVRMSYLPSMSGLASKKTRLDFGAVNVRIGEERTAEVLRNLCYQVYQREDGSWTALCNHIRKHFRTESMPPRYIAERGEIVMDYKEEETDFDLSSSERGLQQTLLLLAYMYANPNAVLLLDEPDAHLEILRQRENYHLLNDTARQNGNQLIIASHSEVILNEAGGKDRVVAFVGKPHTIADQGSQVLKALKSIGFEHYYQAKQTGWILFLEGSTDLAILRAFAKTLDHARAVAALENPSVHYVGNNIQQAKSHFHDLRESNSTICGIALFDRMDRIIEEEQSPSRLRILTWKQKEIENYLCRKETLPAYARNYGSDLEGTVFQRQLKGKREHRKRIMEEVIREMETASEKFDMNPWNGSMKVGDAFLTPLFKNYTEKLDTYNEMDKKNFHELARFVPKERIDPEVNEKLDAIAETAAAADSI